MAGGKKLPQFVAASCICIGAMAMGTALGWTLNITNRLKDGELNGVKMDTNELRWVICVMTLGAMFTCIPVGIFTDMFGRKPVSLILVLPFVIGWLLITFGDHLIMIYIGRILTGVGAGGFCVTAPMYTTEIAEVEIRGFLGTFFYLFITLGILFNCFGYFLNLKIYNICCLIIPLVFGVVFVFQPESPVYYLQQGNRDRAVKSFSRLRGSEYDASGEIAAIQAEIDREKALGGFWQSMKTKASKKAALICFVLMFYQQLCGIYVVIFYLYDIFEKAGINPVENYWCVIIIGIVSVVATVYSPWAVKIFGIQNLLAVSVIVAMFDIATLGLFFTLQYHKWLPSLRSYMIFDPRFTLASFLAIFSIGIGPIPWLATGELFTPDIKGKLTACVGTFHWFLAFLVTQLYMSIYPIIGMDVTFYIFSTITIILACFTPMVPETKGKTIQEIVELLSA